MTDQHDPGTDDDIADELDEILSAGSDDTDAFAPFDESELSSDRTSEMTRLRPSDIAAAEAARVASRYQARTPTTATIGSGLKEGCAQPKLTAYPPLHEPER